MCKFKSYKSSNIELGIIFSHEQSLYKATVLLNNLVYIYEERENARPELVGYFIGAHCVDKVYATAGEVADEQALFTFAVNRLEELKNAKRKEWEAQRLEMSRRFIQAEQAMKLREKFEESVQEKERVKQSLFARLWGELFS